MKFLSLQKNKKIKVGRYFNLFYLFFSCSPPSSLFSLPLFFPFTLPHVSPNLILALSSFIFFFSVRYKSREVFYQTGLKGSSVMCFNDKFHETRFERITPLYIPPLVNTRHCATSDLRCTVFFAFSLFYHL